MGAEGAAWSAFAAEASGADDRGRLVLHAADGVLALLAGARTSEGRALLAFHERVDGGTMARAALHAALIRHTEIDDIHRPTAVTATAIALPAALSVAGDASADRLLDALFVGQAIAVAAASAMGGAALMARGLWPSLLAAPVGAAAAAGRMLGLSPQRMQHALALAIAQTPRSPGRTQGQRPGRWLLFGQAVHAGCLAAAAAQDGIDGDPELLQPASLAAIGGATSPMLPDRPEGVTAALSFKPHCSAKQALAAVHLLQRLLAEGLDPAAIERIDVHVPTAYAAMLQREPGEASRLASMVSVSWQLALTALRPALLDDVARLPVADAGDLRAFAARVHVHADAALDPLYPLCWPARLVILAGGRRHEGMATDSPGDPADAFDAERVLDKAGRVLGPADADLSWVECALRLGTDPRALAGLRQRLDHVGPASA